MPFSQYNLLVLFMGSELISLSPFVYSGMYFSCVCVFVQVPATDRNALNSLWGKLASEILMQNWEAAMEDLTRLRETIDNNVMPRHSEFNTAFGFPYIGHNIDRFAFQHSTTRCCCRSSSPLFHLLIPSHHSSQVKQNLNCCVLSAQLDF